MKSSRRRRLTPESWLPTQRSRTSLSLAWLRNTILTMRTRAQPRSTLSRRIFSPSGPLISCHSRRRAQSRLSTLHHRSLKSAPQLKTIFYRCRAKSPTRINLCFSSKLTRSVRNSCPSLSFRTIVSLLREIRDASRLFKRLKSRSSRSNPATSL